MKIIKYVFISIFCLLVGLFVVVYVYLQNTKPTYKGTLNINHVKGTEVYFDSIGVPHIFAQSEEEAITTLGYVHAQERLWQMELLRRIAAGRLSEIFGKDLLDVDILFSNLGIDETVKKQVDNLHKNPKVKKLVDAYLTGVNAYIDEGKTPVEFTLLGIEKEHYTAKDIYYVTAYMSFSFAHAFKTDPVLTHIKNNLGSNYLKDLAIDSNENTVVQDNYDVRTQSVANINNILNKLPFPQFIGSNGWVLSPQKTTTGKVLFENDPHIGFAQPQVWYQAHIKTPNYENYGFYLGLFPFPLLAHNRDYAFGITMFENDDIDFYTINENANDSTKYNIATGYYDYEFVNKEIKIKGEEAKKITIKKTVLGNVFNQSATGLDSVPTVVNWVYNQKPSKVLQTVYGLNHANNIKQFENAVATLTAPGLNFVYGDKNDNIGLWSAGKLYKHVSENVHTKFVLNATDLSQVQKKWLPFHQNPKAINPAKGYVYTSNVQPAPVNNYYYPGYYLSKDRAVAIKNGIESKEKLSVKDMKNLANNYTNTVAVNNIKSIMLGIDKTKLNTFELSVLNKLKSWNGSHTLQSIAPTIYYKLTFRLLKNTFKDELGTDDFESFVNSNLSKRTQNKYLKNHQSIWWDNVNTPQKESFKDIVTTSFKNSVKELKDGLGDDMNNWKWSKVHTVTHEHALAKMELLKKIFNVGPFSMVGGNETVNNLMFDYTEGNYFKTTAGPSTRRIVDFSDIENSYSVTPTGQSGHFLSPFYNNQTTFYNTGKYFKMLMNEQEIKKSELKLEFK